MDTDRENSILPDSSGGGEFKELLRGDIDIVQYLNEANGGDQPGIQQPGERSVRRSGSSGVLSVVDAATLQLAQAASSQCEVKPAAAPPSTMYARHPAANTPSHVPSSPPETSATEGSVCAPSAGASSSGNGLGSASSPGSSDASSAAVASPPYTPADFYSPPGAPAASSTIIHPPAQHLPPGVILGVHGPATPVDFTMAPYGHQPPVPLQQHAPGAYFAGAGYPLQPVQTQVSPPGTSCAPGAGLEPPSPYVLPQQPAAGFVDAQTNLASPHGHGGGAQGRPQPHRKRPRCDSGNQPPATPFPPGYGSPNNDDDGFTDADGSQSGEQRSIKFLDIEKEHWCKLADANGRELQPFTFHVAADKGFNHSAFDSAYINQKKNHFQISVMIGALDPAPAKYVAVSPGELRPLLEYRLNFFGTKTEMPGSTVVIRQSTNERKPVEYTPQRLDILPARMTKVTVQRLHFSETTMNNQRRNARPNPDQKYFSLVVQLDAITTDGESLCVVAQASEKVIVRASNPGQFDPSGGGGGDAETTWQRAPGAPGAVYHPGPVCIGTDRPHGALTVGGDIAYTGTLFHPSDRRLKENIAEVDPSDALDNMQRIRIVHYDIRPEIAAEWGLNEEQRRRVGVIAQELQEVLPEAVTTEGQYLQVDDNRLFYETAAATKELCRLTGNLEYKIDEVERISKKLSRAARLRRLGASFRSVLSESAASSGVFLGASNAYLAGSLGSLGTGSENADSEQGEELTGGKRKGHRRKLRHGQEGRGLIAMATLYILDWHRRNVERPDWSRSTSLGDRITNVSNTLKVGNMDIPGGGMAKQILPVWGHFAGSLPPPDCNKRLACADYCCESQFGYALPPNYSELLGNDTDSAYFAPHDDAAALGENFANSVLGRFEHRMDSGRDISTSDLTKLDLGPLPISIPDLGVQIDARYCWGTSCNAMLSNYTFYVPVSRYFPPLPIEIQFKVPDQRYVQQCGHTLSDQCTAGLSGGGKRARHALAPPDLGDDGRGFEVDALHGTGAARTWQLPIGGHARTQFVFRAGYSTTLCGNEHDPELGKTYEQYTIVFYRVCDR